MRMKIRRIVRTQGGYILALVLVVLVLGGLLLAPLLGLMGTGLISGRIYERNIDGLYAADAGVEHAMWKIENRDEDVSRLTQCNQSWTGNITEVNGKWVDVEIELVRLEGDVPFDYRIVSRATGDDSETAIEAYVGGTARYSNFSGLLDHLITINKDLSDEEIKKLQSELAPNKVTLAYKDACYTECGDDCFIDENCVPVYDYDEIPDGCAGCGVVYNYPDSAWPSGDVLRSFYWEDVEDQVSYPYNTLDVNDYPDIGPFRKDRVDQKFTITNTGADGLTLQLNGTVYIKDDTLIDGPKDFTIDLKGNTIFVESSTVGSKSALEIGRCAILGPGAIIAVGDIKFAPNGDVGGNGKPVFVMSVSGTTHMHPSATFYGAVAGDFYVYVQSGDKPTLTYPPGGMGDDFNFPGIGSPRLEFGIESWTIIRPDEE